MDIKDIITGCINGDNKAQYQFYTMFHEPIRRVFISKIKDINVTDEVLQTSFIKIFLKLHTFKGENIKGWVYRIVKNEFIDYSRKRKRQVEYVDVDSLEEEIPDEEPIDKLFDFNLENINSAVESLSPSYKEVFSLYYNDSLSHLEISEMLNISVGTSKSNLHKARKNVKKILLTN